jgi:hypothetical protein
VFAAPPTLCISHRPLSLWEWREERESAVLFGRGGESHLKTAIAVFAVVAGCLCSPGLAFATGDANQASCPAAESSPGFRAFLPDCRAYEMTTPVYGGGAPAKLEAASSNGERIIVDSTTGFAEQEDLEDSEGELGSYYTITRTPANWSSESLNPPTSSFTRMHYAGFDSADLRRALFEVVPTAGGGEVNLPAGYRGWDLAVREAAGGGAGRFTLLGPMLSPEHEGERTNQFAEYGNLVVGASSDLSHVFFVLRAEDKQTWPGDQTAAGGQSVYEYSLGEGKEPVLVGVSNNGPVEGSPNVNDGTDLVSDCGTAFDGVSGTGTQEAVYFTALHVAGCTTTQPAANELYERVNGSETKKISGSEPAIFVGASEEGSKAKVFFTEAGKLYEYDAAEERTILLASSATSVPAISGNGERLYFNSPEQLTSKPNGNGETAAEVAGEKLYVCNTQPGRTGIAFVAGETSQLQTTHDGEYLMFASTRAPLGTDDHSSVTQLFEYNATTTAISRVSIGQQSPTGYICPETKTVETGYSCNGNTNSSEDAPAVQQFAPLAVESTVFSFLGAAAQPQGATTDRAIAENGVVVFASRLALTPQATPGVENAYEFRAGQIYLISPTLTPVANLHDFEQPMVDESGADVWFSTLERLVPGDTDLQSSVYDARTEGGYPAPALTSACSGEACQGPLEGAPTFSLPASVVLGASGNLTPPIESVLPTPTVKKPAGKACKKGYVKHKGKCIKAKKKAKKAAQSG